MTKILLIEDNEMNLDMLKRRLQRRGYVVVVALNGREGVELAQVERPDVILMDLSLPGMDGWQATRHLKSAGSTRPIPIIALTAHAMQGDRERAMEAGCDDYDTKPVDLGRLLPKIEALISAQHNDTLELAPATPVGADLEAGLMAADSSTPSILVVDDNEMNRDILRRRLERQGYGVFLAEDGEQALEILSQYQFQLVLLDVMMPGIGGFETLKRIRRRLDKTQMPVIMATARDQSEDVVLAFELGANDYVTKPIDFPVALARIQAQLSLVQAVRESQRMQQQGISQPMALGGRYQVQQILGEGGFSQTFLVKDAQRPGEPVCVMKQLQPRAANHSFMETARRLFKTEAEILEKLGRHDQIPQLLAYFEQEQQFFLVQEYIEGPLLSQELVPGQRMAEMSVVNLVGSVLKVLEFVHSHHVIHRDVKPDNLIRRRDNRLVLIDFGVGKRMQAELDPDHPSHDTVAIGPVGYAPIEQCAGRPTYSSDIYALGMIAIQSLTGRTPDQLVQDPLTSEISWREYAQVSEALAQVLDRMVKRYYKDRYSSATEALKDLYRLPVVRQALERRRKQRQARTNVTS